MSAPRIVVDRDRCMASGLCVFYAPGAFEIGDDMKSTVIDPAAHPADVISTAVESCPMGALSIVDDA